MARRGRDGSGLRDHRRHRRRRRHPDPADRGRRGHPADLQPAGGEPGRADPEDRPDDPEVDALHRGQQLPGGRHPERGTPRHRGHATERVGVTRPTPSASPR